MANRWPGRRIYLHAKVSLFIEFPSLERSTNISRQRRDGIDVLYNFLAKLQFWALDGSVVQSGSSPSCFSREEVMLLTSVSRVLNAMMARLICMEYCGHLSIYIEVYMCM